VVHLDKIFAILVFVVSTGLASPNAGLAKDASRKPGLSEPSSSSNTDLSDQYRIVDGDTFVLGDKKIRLWGMDAPELHQKCLAKTKEVPCGKAAQMVLAGIFKSGPVICETIDIDRYKRIVGRCMINDLDVAATMVRLGWAFDYPEYSKGTYKAFEDEAKADTRGLWAYQFDRPSDWRRGTRRYNSLSQRR
jgi:endonuclease YncB( thermonuclease family)